MPEYGITIHIDATYSGPLPGGRSEAGIAGYQEVVVAGGTGLLKPTGDGQGVKGR